MQTEKETTDIVPVADIPMIPIDQLTKLTNYVNQVKKALMVEGKDYVIRGGKQYTARSGFAKLAQGFVLSDEIIQEERIEKDEEFYGFDFVVRVFNANGRQSTGVGSCTIDEPNIISSHKERPYHDCRSIAYTRAYNRAVSNFVGSADVSAEEMSLENGDGTKLVDAYQTEDDSVGIQLPEDFATPDWEFEEELKQQGWGEVSNLTGIWLQNAGFFTPSDHFEYGHDTVKAYVKQKGYFGEAFGPINEMLMAAGYRWHKNEKRWRLVKPEGVE